MTIEGAANSKLRVLIISWSFPPEAEVGALRMSRFCRHLPGFGIEPIVLTAQSRFYQGCDATWPVPAGIRVERTTVMSTPVDWYARLKKSLKNERANAGDNPLSRPPKPAPSFLKRQLLAALQTPDKQWGWYLPAIRSAEELIRRERIDVLFSSGPPWLCHLIGRHLKKRWRLPWLADFRDPWACGARRDQAPAWREWIEHRLMEDCVHSADRVICNTDRLRDRLTVMFPDLQRSKFVTITNGLDENSLPVSAPEAHSGKLLLHLGSLYRGRRIDTFCRALNDLVDKRSLDPDSLKVLFIGDMDPSIVFAGQEQASKLVESKCIEFRRRIRWEEAQRVLASADLLLLFFDEDLAVPAKFYEYLQTGKPILAITTPGALTDTLISTRAGVWADPEHPADISAKLLQALQMPTRTPADVQSAAQCYQGRTLTSRLADSIRGARPASPA